MKTKGTKLMARSTRGTRGSALVEFGPALLILLMMLFFPLVDMMTLALDYASCYTLNNLQVREAAELPSKLAQEPTGLVKQQVPQRWQHSGLGAFVPVIGSPDTNLNYIAGETDTNGSQDSYVCVTTTLTARPFVVVPFLVPVPGLNAPMTFSISTRRLLENPHFV